MAPRHRWNRPTAALLALAALVPTGGVARAGGKHQKAQVLIPVQSAPVMMAPSAVTYAQAPVTYAAQAPVAYTAQAPVAYTAQAPVTYAQAPVVYGAGATAAVGSAPIGSAPVGAAPTTEGIRISVVVRQALLADLIAFYHGQESGTTRLEKLRAVRDRAREEYTALLEDEADPDLNPAEQRDLDSLVDLVITGGHGGAERTYYPPIASAPPGYYGGYQGRYIEPGVGAVVPVPAPAPTLIPVVRLKPVHPRHHLFHKN